MKYWRSALLIASLLFIAKATLTSAGGSVVPGPRPDFWCLACGNEGGADVTLNVALFIPLGVSLALLGVSFIRATAIGALLSLAIECAQHYGYPAGRVASFTDLLTNSTGALIGAIVTSHCRSWLHPTPRRAAWFVCVSVIVIASFLGFTGWALGRDKPLPIQFGTGPIRQSTFAFTREYGWYHGAVSRATVNGTEFVRRGDGPMMLYGSAEQQLYGEVEMTGRDERASFEPFLYMHGSYQRTPELMLGQRKFDLELQARLRGSRLRFPGPRLSVADVFVDEGNIPRTISFLVVPQVWRLSSTTTDGTVENKLPISLSLGWTLFQSVVHVGDRFGWVMLMVWLPMFWLPVGYWCAIAGGVRVSASSARTSGNKNVVPFVTAGVTALLLTLWLVPRTMEISPCLPREWIGAILGLSVGVFFASSLSETQQPTPFEVLKLDQQQPSLTQ